MSNKPDRPFAEICEMVFWLCLFTLIALCVGDPDVLDAIRDWIDRQP